MPGVVTQLENPQKSGNFTMAREKLGKLQKVREIVVCLWCATAVVTADSATVFIQENTQACPYTSGGLIK